MTCCEIASPPADDIYMQILQIGRHCFVTDITFRRLNELMFDMTMTITRVSSIAMSHWIEWLTATILEGG